jgi:trimeric autotransporter adhesin
VGAEQQHGGDVPLRLDRFHDDDTLSIDFDPATLGFSSNFLNQMQTKKFPGASPTTTISARSTRRIATSTRGARTPRSRGWSAVTPSRSGGDYRTIGIDTQSFSGGSGDFVFTRHFTSVNPLANGTATSGNAFASFLMGDPSGNPGNQSRILQSAPANYFVRYYGAYIQDDFRVSSRLTLNAGLRVEHETGPAGRGDRFTVAFDRTSTRRCAGQRHGQRPARARRPRLRGPERRATYQGNPPAAKISPRVGMVYSAIRGP